MVLYTPEDIRRSERLCNGYRGFYIKRGEERPDSGDINVLALVKGRERYVFFYDDDNRAEVLRALGEFASDNELNFTWYDAAVLSQKIRQESQKQSLQNRID